MAPIPSSRALPHHGTDASLARGYTDTELDLALLAVLRDGEYVRSRTTRRRSARRYRAELDTYAAAADARGRNARMNIELAASLVYAHTGWQPQPIAEIGRMLNARHAGEPERAQFLTVVMSLNPKQARAAAEAGNTLPDLARATRMMPAERLHKMVRAQIGLHELPALLATGTLPDDTTLDMMIALSDTTSDDD